MVEIIVSLIAVLGILSALWLLHHYPPEIRIRKDNYTFDGAKGESLRWLQEQNERMSKQKSNTETK